MVFNWETYYIPLIERIKAGGWESRGLPLAGIDIGLADVTPLGDAVPAEARERIMATRQQMIDGTFNPYTGPINKQSGETLVGAGQVLDDGGLWGMDYFVEGVTGTMPKSQ